MADSQYFAGLFSHRTSNSAITDLTAPTFAGIVSATPNADGSITAAWALGSDASTPINYVIYMMAGVQPAATLFASAANIVQIVRSTATLARMYVDTSGNALINGAVYTLGVRARDGVGNIESNMATQQATSQGVPSNSLFNLLTAIKAKTDPMTFDGSDYLNVHTKVNDDKTGYTLTAPDKAALVALIWNELTAGYTTPNTFGANLDATITSRATQASVDAIQNNTRFVGVVPPILVLPPSSTKSYRFFASLYDETGNPEAPDSGMNINITDTSGGSIVASTAMTADGVGRFYYDYVVDSSDTERALIVNFTYAENSISFTQSRVTEVQEFESKLDTLLARLSSNRALALDNLDATISSRADQASADQIIAQTDAQTIADAVWDELLSAHQDVGSAGLYLSQSTSQGIAEAVWGLIRSGNMASGTFGEIMDALISSRASQTSLNNLQITVDGLQSNPNQFVGTVEEDGVIAGTADTGT